MTDWPPVIALVGAPGSGKTTVGRLLAARIEVPFVDLDEAIAESYGRPLAEVFADGGEADFRLVEQAVTLAGLAGPGVVAVGGGAVLMPEVAAALERVTTVWLEVSIQQATRRLGLNQAGGLLLGNLRGRLIQSLAARTPIYRAIATVRVDTDRVAPAEVVERVIDGLIEPPE